MPREREYGSDAERQRAYRERKALQEQDRGKPWQGLLGEEREQAIRDFFGYAASETRSKAERDAVARRIMARSQKGTGSLPGFPSRPNDLAPSSEALAKLGGAWKS